MTEHNSDFDDSGKDDFSLLRRARDGDEGAFNRVLGKHREKLKRMVAVRMNPRLRSRLDASDVIQDTFVEALRTFEQFLSHSQMPVYVWLRALANEKLIQAHRFHLKAQKRDASREMSIFGNALSATSEAIAVQLIGRDASPVERAERNDRKRMLTEALDKMGELDREILTLRHFEHMSSKQAAVVLNLKVETVKKRYVRALEKLQRILIND